MSPGIYVLGFLMYVALAFVSIFFNAAVIGTAMKRLKGEPASIKDGLALARQHIGKIFVWAVVTATVGMIIRTIQERSGLIGRILLGIVGIAWTVLTFFVVPVLLYEDVSVGGAIKRSGSIFRQRWGEQFIGNATIGIAIFLVAIPIVLVGGLIAAAAPIVGIPLLVVAVGRPDGDRRGLHGRVQRCPLPLRHHRRELRAPSRRTTWPDRSARAGGARARRSRPVGSRGGGFGGGAHRESCRAARASRRHARPSRLWGRAPGRASARALLVVVRALARVRPIRERRRG